MLNVLFFGKCLEVSKRFHTFAQSKDYFDYPVTIRVSFPRGQDYIDTTQI